MSDTVGEGKAVDLPGITFGTMLQVQIEGQGMAPSRLVGFDPGAFLIVKTPSIAEIATQLYEKNHVVVRYFSAGWVYAFRCTLLSLIKEPWRLAILSYPEDIEKINIRKHDRVDCNIEVEALIGGQTHAGVVKNVSAGGMAMEIDKKAGKEIPQLNVNDVIVMTMHRDSAGPMSLKMVVRNIKVDRAVMIVGMEFFTGGSEKRENLDRTKWLENLISENL